MSGASTEIHEVLGADATLFCATYDITPQGNWEETNIPNLLVTGDIPPDLDARLAPMREKLLARRATRVRPGLDDKVLADWNGLMIAALVRAATLLDRPEWIGLAQTAYRFIAESMSREGRLGHSWRGGRADLSGFRPRSCRHDARPPSRCSRRPGRSATSRIAAPGAIRSDAISPSAKPARSP